jgi:hypothetical protein
LLPRQIRLRTSEAYLSDGSAMLALEGAEATMQHLAQEGSGAPGGATTAIKAAGCFGGACRATATATRAANLQTRALLAQGRHKEAALRLTQWLGEGCPDAPAAADALGALLDDWDPLRPGAAEHLCGAAAAAARAFPGRHDPAMAVVERLLALPVGTWGMGAAAKAGPWDCMMYQNTQVCFIEC